MNAKTYVTERQIAWARRNQIKLMAGPKSSDPVNDWDGKRIRNAYTTTLEDNLFEPLDEETRSDFEAADGGELKRNMRALYSSSAMTCNLFHHLRRPENQPFLLEALGIPQKDIQSIRFEQKRKVIDDPKGHGFPHDPNLDLVIRFQSSPNKETAIECKFREPWSGRSAGITAKYPKTQSLWPKLPNLNSYVMKIGTGEQDLLNQHLHAAQLIKHLLGLHYENRVGGKGSFELIYLFYDVPGEEGARHLTEVTAFANAARADGIRFRWITCQEFILRLLKHRTRFPEFVDYLTERYL